MTGFENEFPLGDSSRRAAERFSIVSAVYNVGRYLPEFIASIEAQSFPLDRVQVVVVDDGSTDDSLVILKEWQERRPELVTVLSKENGGQASARNLGVEHATGEWVTFTDPDDTLAADYFEIVDLFLTDNPQTELVATKFIYHEEALDRFRDGHPLRWRFRYGDQVVNLNRFPTYFHGSAPAAFFRLETIRQHQLQFDPRIRPNFEDGHFCVLYLLEADEPLVGFVGSAAYYYRRRADQTSTLQKSLTNPGRYTAVPRYGYLHALQEARSKKGHAPEWLQNLIIYELSWFFSAEDSASGVVTAATGDVASEFIPLLKQIAEELDATVVDSFSVRLFYRKWRDVLLHGLAEENWHTSYVVMQRYDDSKQQVRVAYRFVGDLPKEEFLVRGKPVTIQDRKIRTHEYFGHTLLKERVVWLSAKGTVRIKLDDRAVELRTSWLPPTRVAIKPAAIRAEFIKAPDPKPAKKLKRLAWRDRLAIRLARSLPVRRAFADAWVIMDRIHDADDSGEHLFRYLRKSRRNINAWFVIEAGTPDWDRLKRDRYRRVVPYGSFRWRLLMLNCRHLVSSHIDEPVHRPPAIDRLRTPDWKFTFLQHGVIKDDLSRWLNPKKLDLFITSTGPEYESIAGDNTPYDFTSKEVKLTGLPRFDRLREIGASVSTPDRDLILLAPTWRHWLTPPLAVGSQRRELYDDFLESQFAQQWLGVLNSEALAELARARGLSIAFLPHPNLQSALSGLSLPDHVLPLHFEGQDVQKYFARAAVMVTDYSSMAFNSAYIDRAVVYFQFDRERVLNGGHVGRAGYFDYYRDGFGPVVETIDETIASVREVVENGKQVPLEFQERINRTFTQRDGRCCERVVRAIEAL